MAPMRLYFLALDGGKYHEHILSLEVTETWNLSRLREALRQNFSVFRGKFLDQIKVWVLSQYLDAHTPDPCDLDIEAPSYKGVPLIKIGPMTTIVSYFNKPFNPGEERKIHFVVQLGPIRPSNSTHSNLAKAARDTDEPPAKRQRLEDKYLLAWQKFRARLWGKGEAYVQSDMIIKHESKHGVFNTMLVDRAFRLRALQKLLIREEWEEAWKFALMGQNDGDLSFIIIGHPGIGKTLSLYYFLVMRVALGLPTFFQTDPDILLLFHRGGVDIIHETMWENIQGVNFEAETTWALVDSNRGLGDPANVLWRFGAPIFIVQAASPRKHHWEWTKDHGPKVRFYVKPFSLQEMLQGNLLQAIPANEDSVRNFYIKYGPSARDCYLACNSNNALLRHGEEVNQYIEGLSSDMLIRLIATSHHDHLLVVIEPIADNPLLSKTNIITRTVMRRLWQAHRRRIQESTAYLYDVFSQKPHSSITASWLFEGFVHDLLDGGIEKPLYNLTIKLKGGSNTEYDEHMLLMAHPEALWKSQKMEYVPFTGTDDHLELQKDCYYVDIESRFLTYDSFTFQWISTSDYQDPILDTCGSILTGETKSELPHIGLFTVFRVVVANEHDVKEQGLAKLLEIAAYNELKAIAIRYIAVFPPNCDTAIKLPVTWQGKVSMFGFRLS